MFRELVAGAEVTWVGCLVRVLLSAFVGFIFGFERKARNNPIGMRTLMLISVSSCLLAIISTYAELVTINGVEFHGDPGRITAAIVSGIGFVGGGAIMHHGLNIKGLTSAAVIWTTAAIGIAIGCGYPEFAFITFFVAFVSLTQLERVEEKFFPAEHIRHIFLVFENKKLDIKALVNELQSRGIYVTNTDIARVFGEKHLEITFTVRAPNEFDVFDLTDAIKQIGKLEEFRLTD